jgi:hypothetical protein
LILNSNSKQLIDSSKEEVDCKLKHSEGTISISKRPVVIVPAICSLNIRYNTVHDDDVELMRLLATILKAELVVEKAKNTENALKALVRKGR